MVTRRKRALSLPDAQRVVRRIRREVFRRDLPALFAVWIVVLAVPWLRASAFALWYGVGATGCWLLSLAMWLRKRRVVRRWEAAERARYLAGGVEVFEDDGEPN